MPSFHDLHDELFICILEYVVDGLSLADAVPLRLVDHRFRDSIIPLYTRTERFLLSDKLGGYQVAPASIRYLHDITLGVVERYWNDPRLISPELARCVGLIERRIHHLFPYLPRAAVHRKFCELVIRERNSAICWLFGLDDRMSSTIGTLRNAIRSDTEALLVSSGRTSMSHVETILTLEGDDPAIESTAPSQQSPGLQMLDRIARIAVVGFGLVDADAAAAPSSPRELLLWDVLPDRFLSSTLWTAACMGQSSVIERCLDMLFQTQGPARSTRRAGTISHVDNILSKALAAATEHGHVDSIRTMLDHAMLRRSAIVRRPKFLETACHYGWVDCAQAFVETLRSPARPTYPIARDRCKGCILTRILEPMCNFPYYSGSFRLLLNEGASLTGTCGLDQHAFPPALGRPLEVALLRTNSRVVALMLDHGASHTVAYTGHFAFVHLKRSCVLREDDVDLLRHFDRGGALLFDQRWSLLPSAARYGAMRCVLYMLDNHPVVGWKDPDVAGKTIIAAAQGGHMDVLRLLLERGNQELLLKVLDREKDSSAGDRAVHRRGSHIKGDGIAELDRDLTGHQSAQVASARSTSDIATALISAVGLVNDNQCATAEVLLSEFGMSHLVWLTDYSYPS